MLAVDVKNIKKTFKTKQDTVEAVKDVSFEVKKGEIFGLLGPNGAGKSTTILMLTTLLQVTGGQAKIFDLDVTKDDKLVREKIGANLLTFYIRIFQLMMKIYIPHNQIFHKKVEEEQVQHWMNLL